MPRYDEHAPKYGPTILGTAGLATSIVFIYLIWQASVTPWAAEGERSGVVEYAEAQLEQMDGALRNQAEIIRNGKASPDANAPQRDERANDPLGEIDTDKDRQTLERMNRRSEDHEATIRALDKDIKAWVVRWTPNHGDPPRRTLLREARRTFPRQGRR